jgi:hypothetical protein
MPGVLLEPDEKPSAKVQRLTREEQLAEGLLPMPPPGTRMTLIVRPPKNSSSKGFHQLSDVISESLWRMRDTGVERSPDYDGIVLTEIDPREIRWTNRHPELFFRRENKGGVLPEVLRNQMNILRGNVILTEVFEPTLDHLKVSRGSLLRADSDWISIRYEKVDPAQFGIPELAPGTARLEFRHIPFGRPVVKEPVLLAPKLILSCETLSWITPASHWQAYLMTEDAVLRSTRWKMEAAL